jgi:SAM-dependent methyltransferase
MKAVIQHIFNRLGYQISRLDDKKNAGKKSKALDFGYISAAETVQKAKENGLSICDYVEKSWNQVGETQKVIDNMSGWIDFETIFNVCEIGPGTGRYTEKVLQRKGPGRYEIYETASDWMEYLSKSYPVVACQTNGKDLSNTESNSIDLLHSHGVFVYLPFIVSMLYFKEMVRTVKTNGYIVFDFFCEDCMSSEIVDRWIQAKEYFPTFLSSNYVDEYFQNNGFKKIGEFYTKHGQGKSHYTIYKKES